MKNLERNVVLLAIVLARGKWKVKSRGRLDGVEQKETAYQRSKTC